MRKGDLVWIAVLVLVLVLMISPWTSATFEKLTAEHPYYMGFIKFFILASMGELLAIRLNKGHYQSPPYLLVRAIIWGIVGIFVVYTFTLYSGGISALLSRKLLPDLGTLFTAFMTALTMNLTFGPVFMAAHRISDKMLERRAQAKRGIVAAIREVDWVQFMTFVVGKTIPFFWIPAHTITFLLPPQYRVLVAAMLSIALGLILSFAKMRRKEA